MGKITGIEDRHGRRIDYARISLTDRCNYRCVYCMPAEGVPLLDHREVMRYEETLFLCEILAELGVRKFRFTGGEPLVRKGAVDFLREVRRRLPDIAISITTNAALLAQFAPSLREISLAGMNVSLDTIDPQKFRTITRIGDLSCVVAGIDAAVRCGIPNIKTNTVLIRGFNENELPKILDFAWQRDLLPRMIEFMPLGDDVWQQDRFIGAAEILDMLNRYGTWSPVRERSTSKNERIPMGPAAYYQNAASGKRVGVIEAVSNHFCAACNRLRITASGHMRACLFSDTEIPLVDMIRKRDGDALKRAILNGIDQKPDCWENMRDGKQRMSGIGG